MGQRQRKKKRLGSERLSSERLSSAERDEQARAALVPLAPNERPWPATAAALVAFLLGAANLVALVAGVEIDGKRPGAAGVIAFAAVMFAAAWGIWNMRYWAVLGFQALLALIVLVFFLFLLRASSLAAAGIAVAVVAIAGLLFWKLIRVMARMQMPEGP